MGLTKKEIKYEFLIRCTIQLLPANMMIYSRFNNNRVKSFADIWLIYSDKTSPYEEVLEKDGPVSIHYKKI